jgi:hypothetical protein
MLKDAAKTLSGGAFTTVCIAKATVTTSASHPTA